MSTKIFKDFCPESLLEGRAEILEIFGWHFGKNDDLINSFGISDLHKNADSVLTQGATFESTTK